MIEALPVPEVVRCYFDEVLTPRLPAMCLRWPDSDERVWELPEGVRLVGPAPERFGVSIQRQGEDAYTVRLIWNRTGLTWPCLTRAELLPGDLAILLEAMGTDLWYLLDQPIGVADGPPSRAA
jgi:hypothetical protein